MKWVINLLGKIRVPIRLLPFLGTLVATAVIILTPVGGVPYIEVDNSNFTFDLPAFQTCEIVFQDSIRIKDYGVGVIPNASATNAEIHFMPTVVNASVAHLLVRNPWPIMNGADHFKVVIEDASTIAVRISSVSLDGKRLNLKSFAANNLKIRNSEYVRFHYIRRYLASWIFKFNDVFSNWILTALAVGLVITSCKVCDMELQAYVFSDKRLKKKLGRLLSIKRGTSVVDKRKAFDKFIAGWQKWDSRFRFLQAFGPAIGFILTVSSLVEVLHPASRSSNDLDVFLTGIHVAMISTFLGLLLRLVALEGGRVNDALLDRADMLIDAEESETETTETNRAESK